MLEKAAEELHDIEGEDSGTLAVRLAIANQHGAILNTNDARVGDGDFEDIGSEIFESSLAGRDRLRVDVPVDVPDISRNLTEEFCLFHQIAELGAEDLGERFDGEIEVSSGGMPAAID